MAARTRAVAPLLFLSGLCALVYQVAWTREFRLVFGASTAASAAVLAIFIGGLGVGGLLIGPRADRHPRPLWLYARLEALVAITAALTPLLLALARSAYIAAGGTLALGLAGGTLVRLVLSAVVLAVPTVLMGGTLPAAARAVEIASEQGRRNVAALYGVNTLGAVAGAFVGTFFMIEAFGTRRTLWLACLLNLLVSVLARQVDRLVPEPASAAAPPQEELRAAAPPRFVLAAAAVVGFAFFLMEIVWYRMLGPILGGTVFTFGLILATALLGIGLGGAAYALARENRPATLGGFAATCLLEALCLAAPLALGDRVALLAAVLRGLGGLSFAGFVSGWAIVTALVVLPASFVAGYQFPLLVGLLGSGREDLGRQIGLAYAFNTGGAIVGSLAGGFGLLPALSATGVWRATALVLLGLGSWAAVRAARRLRLGLLGPSALGLATVALLAATGPTAVWRHSQIGAGRVRLPPASPNAYEDWWRGLQSRIVWERDGVESSVALAIDGPGLAFLLNGKNDGNTRADAPTMVMSGLIGAALHERPRTAMVIGLGTGCTAGWLAAAPGVARVDVVELEPRILDVARDAAPVNRAVLDNPSVHVSIGDAREALLVTKRRYDIVFSQPSNPYRAGVASLFTREYYEAVRGRLEPGGFFLQWVQTYEVDVPTIRTVYATLRSAFPHVETWQVGRGDLVLLASERAPRYSADALRARIGREPFRSALRTLWDAEDLEGFLAWFVAGDGVARDVLARESHLNTDDRNVVEFGFARSLGRAGLFDVAMLREAAALRGDDRPSLLGQVDWSRTETARMTFHPQESMAPLLWPRLRPELRAAGRFWDRVLVGDHRAAVAAWEALPPATQAALTPRTVARSLAEIGDERAVSWIERLAPASPHEASALRGLLRVRQGRIEEALPDLEASLLAYREDPWPDPGLMRRVIEAAGDAAAAGQAARLLPVLRAPFVLRAFDDARLVALAQAFSRLGPVPECAQTIAGLEPLVPWVHDWLELRVRCYEAAGDPRVAAARADLGRFLSREPRRFSDGLLP